MADPRYNALIAAWGAQSVPAGFTGTPLNGLTTLQKIAAVNSWSQTGSVPTNFTVTGSQVLDCINYSEFKGLTDAQKKDIWGLGSCSGALLGGSGNVNQLVDGLILDYFTPQVAITSGTYNSGTGLVTLTMGATVKFSNGTVVVQGLTGTGAFASLNGTFPVALASGTTVTYNAGAGLGAATITGGSLVPPTIAALTALAKAAVLPWWQVSVAGGGGGLFYPIDASDAAAAGLS